MLMGVGEGGGYEEWTTGGSYTWTVPAGVTVLKRVVCVGGGAGGTQYYHGGGGGGLLSLIHI